MAWTSNGANAELQAGMSPTPVTGHVNPFSHTLGGTLDDSAGAADQGLADTSGRWSSEGAEAAVTPHSVLAPYSFSRSANGSDGQNYLPDGAYLGNSDGMSSTDFENNLSLRMAGGKGNLT
jgi:hypothetical protein